MQFEDTLEKITKRKVLSSLAKLFDPLGLVLPVTVKGKVLMREIWTLKLDWDEELPNSLVKEFKKLHSDFHLVHGVHFPRQVLDLDSKSTLIFFCDASKEAYGFVCYVVNEQTGTASNIFSKCKSAPLKSKTLPTLEFLSFFLAFKCSFSILNLFSCEN